MFLMGNNVGKNVGAFRPIDGFEVHGGAPFDARDQEPLEGISSVEGLHCERVKNLDAHPNTEENQVQTTRQDTRLLTRTSFWIQEVCTLLLLSGCFHWGGP